MLWWQCASQSGGNRNIDVGEIDHYVFSYVKVMFCVSGVCNKSSVPLLTLIFVLCCFCGGVLWGLVFFFLVCFSYACLIRN